MHQTAFGVPALARGIELIEPVARCGGQDRGRGTWNFFTAGERRRREGPRRGRP